MEDPLQQPGAQPPSPESSAGPPAPPAPEAEAAAAAVHTPAAAAPEEASPLFLLLAGHLESWFLANRAALAVIGIALAIATLNDLIRYPVLQAAAAHPEV
ncbi:MAG: hypothetical protein ABSE73_06745, partial [Planctomycetota bacterium]